MFLFYKVKVAEELSTFVNRFMNPDEVLLLKANKSELAVNVTEEGIFPADLASL